MGLRAQLPAWSPLSLRTIAQAAFAQRDAAARVHALLEERFRCERALLLDSGTSALALAIRAAARARTGPVALPAYGCYDLATAALGAGVGVVLYDVDPDTLQPDAASVERVLARGACALVVAHLYGFPVLHSRLHALAERAGALLIEDAAQAFGARTLSAQVGNTAALTVLSFGRGKGLTGGGGGALLARGEGAVALDSTRAPASARRGGAGELARLGVQWLLGRPSFYGIPASLPFLHLGETLYHEPWAPRAASAASLAAVAAAWRDAEHEVTVRSRTALRLQAGLRAPLQPVAAAPETFPGFLRLPVRWLGGRRLDRRSKALGIAPGYPLALPDLSALAPALLESDESWSGARRLARELITLPTHSRLNAGDVKRLEAWCGEVRARGSASARVEGELEAELRR